VDESPEAAVMMINPLGKLLPDRIGGFLSAIAPVWQSSAHGANQSCTELPQGKRGRFVVTRDRSSRFVLSQPHARATAVGVDELDTSFLKGAADR
jgi:hypothetical protein